VPHIIQITPFWSFRQDESSFLSAVLQARSLHAFVLDPVGGALAVYRPAAESGRFIGVVPELSPDAVVALLSDGRCPFCAWPSDTGFPNERAQRTPLCDHSRPVRLRCAVCAEGTIGRQWYDRDNGYGVCSRCFIRHPVVATYGYPGVHHSLYGDAEAHLRNWREPVALPVLPVAGTAGSTSEAV
jgi:hypothetical protein